MFFIQRKIRENQTTSGGWQMNHWSLDDGIKRTQKVLGAKANEYAQDNDRLWNFRRIQAILKLEFSIDLPLHIIVAILQYKHRVSVIDMTNEILDGKQFNEAYIDEKCGDYTNYSLLFELALREENESKNIN